MNLQRGRGVQYTGTVLAAIGHFSADSVGFGVERWECWGWLEARDGVLRCRPWVVNVEGLSQVMFILSWDRPNALHIDVVLEGNARRDKIALEAGTQDLTEEQKLLERELADNVPWFRYTT
jgi:hypothetical protein